MQKVKYIDAFCILNFFLLTLTCLFLSSINDTLLFKSDLINLVHYILGVSLLLLIICCAPFFTIFLIVGDKKREKITFILPLLTLANLLFGFVHNVVLMYAFHLRPISWLFFTAVILYVICLFVVLLLPEKYEINLRISKLSRWSTLFVIVSLIFLTSFRHIQKKLFFPLNKKINVVMIIMDGLGTKALPYYNSNVKIKQFDDISKASKLYMNVYTNYTYTSDYFRVLYTGRKDRATEGKNLLSVLQKAGVNTRWLVFHRAGIPDSRGIFSYDGLRSYFLHHRLAWIPYLFGIDYNVIYRFNRRKETPGRSLIYLLMNKLLGRHPSKPLEKYLKNEIERLRSDGRPYFLIFYTMHHAFAERNSEDKQNDNKLPELWKTNFSIKSKKNEIDKKIRANEYVYEEKDSWLVKEWSGKYKNGVKHGILSLKRFYDAYKEKKWHEDTILIVTADHGEIFGKGKVWYGFHNEEEVTKVPLIMHDGKNIGICTRLGETIDITQTILEWFGINEKLSDKAISLIGNNEKKIVTTLTLHAKKRDEQFLNVYTCEEKAIYKYVFNLKKKDYARKELVNGFNTIIVDHGKSILNNLDFDLKDVLNDHGIK